MFFPNSFFRWNSLSRAHLLSVFSSCSRNTQFPFHRKSKYSTVCCVFFLRFFEQDDIFSATQIKGWRFELKITCELLTFLLGLGCSCRKGFLGVLTVKFDLRFDLLDSSKRSRSNFQNPPFPGSSFDLATFTKHLFRDRLCRIEF